MRCAMSVFFSWASALFLIGGGSVMLVIGTILMVELMSGKM